MNRKPAILGAFEGPHCGICQLGSEAARAWLKGILQDGVNDPTVRHAWRSAGGLCAAHWRDWRALESPALSSAVMTEDLLASWLAGSGGSPGSNCGACQVQADAVRVSLLALQRIKPPAVEEALAHGQGFLCIDHLGRLRNARLQRTFRSRLESIRLELLEFIRKNDYRFAAEPKGTERDSWLRAIRALGGEV